MRSTIAAERFAARSSGGGGSVPLFGRNKRVRASVVVTQGRTSSSSRRINRRNVVQSSNFNNSESSNNSNNSNNGRSSSAATLILLRHGQSEWNGPNKRFTGWADVPLTVRGRVEAVAAGQLLRSRGFTASKVDVAFTSCLQRAHETCELVLASMAGAQQHTWSTHRIRRDIRLNERHYGGVQGLRKDDPALLQEYGNDRVLEWRRSMFAKPPPITPDHPYYNPSAPLTESLADCQQRALACFHDSIVHAMVDEQDLPSPPHQRAVLVVAHSNTIRSLMAAFDKVPDPLVPKLHVPNSVPILYRFDIHTRQPVSTKLESAAGGSHARWLVSAENHTAVREALQPGGMLTRALFEALDKNNDRSLTALEIDFGLQEFFKEHMDDEHPIDCVAFAVAKKIARELSPRDKITLEEFEKLATLAYQGLQLPSEQLGIRDSEPFP